MSKTEEKKNPQLLTSKVIRTYLSNARHATAKTKKRGEVSGGGKKPWKQKGTGRARAGSSRSPIWRGGGIVFGPTGVQNFNLKVSKKEKALALTSAFDSKKSVTVALPMPKATKTKEAAEFLKKNELCGKVLLLLDIVKVKGEAQSEAVANLKRVFKNIPNVTLMFKSEANAYDVLRSDMIAIVSEKKAEAKKTDVKEAK